jgi:hypothetical protein
MGLMDELEECRRLENECFNYPFVILEEEFKLRSYYGETMDSIIIRLLDGGLRRIQKEG